MECESDESERWEDFFGSSTDLSPSVIAYYDRLSSSCGADTTANSINSNCNGSVHRPLGSSASTSNTSCSNNTEIVEPSRLKLARPPLPKLPPPSIRLHTNNNNRRNFRVLSANVQRIISHSNTALDTVTSSVMENELKHTTPIGNESFLHERRTNSALLKLSSSGGASKFKHPLSKNTCKLTQSGNELVIDDSDAGYATPSDSSEIVDAKDNANNNNHCDGDGHDIDVDHDKTPTNENLPEIDFAAAAMAAAAAATKAQCDVDFNQVLDELKVIKCATVNDWHCDEQKKDCLSNVTPPTTASTPLLNLPKNSGSFLHSMFAKSDEKLSPLRLSGRRTSQFYVDQDECVPNAAATAATPTIVETPTAPATNTNSSIKDVTPTDAATSTADDLKRTKIRPLSSVSISSTSSSSSTGSDEMSPNQTAISYLASVESLADHSETESLRIGPSITVLERACMEIVDSEQNYVNDLCQVINGYLNDWRQRSCLEADRLNMLFGNIEQVYDFNMILLNELKSSGMEAVRLAKCFIKLHDQFDAYTHYCTSYPDAISLLTTLLQASTTNSLLTSTQKRLNHTLPLGSYLLKPVQRILKYHLLLDNLRKHCDVPEVAQAHEIMKNVARNIDQVKRSLEQQSRVKELSGILDGWLGPELTVLGDLKLEGMLMESSKPRSVLLFQNMLIITKKKEDNRLQLKTYIQCKDLMLIEHFPGEPASFSVIPYNDVHPNQIKLTARNREQKRQWAQHIKHVMLAHFNIPNRAKELLFQLGEEDDLPPDKNTWKWSHSSSSTTPEYLGRRNQFRRSEMRYRTKKARELFSTSLSMVEDITSPIVSGDDPGKVKVLDSMIKELRQRNSTIKCDDDKDKDDETAIKEPDELAMEVSEDMILEAYDKLLPFDGEKVRKTSALDRAKLKLQEVRRYNTKTLPKRIANLKKQRSKTLKETSHFYMDLPPSETISPTVLKITESPEKANEMAYRRRASLDGTEGTLKILSAEDDTRKMSTASLASMPSMSLRIEHSQNGPTKRDIDIIAELLKHHKDEFDRILKKPPKKSPSLTDVEKSAPNFELKTVKPPPDETPQPSLAQRLSNFKRDVALHEPLYESLLRNVHVPYKFPSPVLNRSASQPQCRFPKFRRPTEAPPKRPDSDYVTLNYSESGELAGVDGKLLAKNGKQFRKSDTNINYNGHRSSSADETEDSRSAILLNESVSSETDAISMNDNESNAEVAEGVSTDALSELSLSIVDHHKSVENLDSDKLPMKLPERRVSDVTGMHHKSIIHKQGGRALGSRIASVDYADPKLLFGNHQNHHRRSQTFINRISKKNIQLQRDSVLSSTSSNDSVNTNHANDTTNALASPPSPPFDASKPLPDIPIVDDCYYEKNIDTCLESDEVFRDSAIYSDECNEKRYMRPEHIYSTINEVKETAAAKPIPPPKIPSHKIQPIPLRTAPPPPLPAKPTNLPASLRTLSANDAMKNISVSMEHLSSMPPSLPPPPLPPPIVPPRRDRPPSQSSASIGMDTLSKCESISISMAPLGDLPPIPLQEQKSVSSWVLMQIKNFDK